MRFVFLSYSAQSTTAVRAAIAFDEQYSRLWGNVNVLARCGNDKRYYRLMYRPQEIMWLPRCPLRGRKAGSWQCQTETRTAGYPATRTVLDINQLVDAISLRDLSPINLSS